jgi:hypothetical protein
MKREDDGQRLEQKQQKSCSELLFHVTPAVAWRWGDSTGRGKTRWMNWTGFGACVRTWEGLQNL